MPRPKLEYNTDANIETVLAVDLSLIIMTFLLFYLSQMKSYTKSNKVPASLLHVKRIIK